MKTKKREAYNILIVDDIYSNREILKEVLEDEGYHVKAVVNGHFALVSAANDAPDLILLDILMPEMDGLEVCRRLKSDPKTKNIPIIFISALDDSKDVVNAINVGGADYVTKPFIAKEIINRVATQLRINEQKQRIDQQNEKIHKLQEIVKEFKFKKKK